MATCCGADPEGYAHSYTHYVELRPTTQRGSGYVHMYLETVHTEMNHSPLSPSRYAQVRQDTTDQNVRVLFYLYLFHGSALLIIGVRDQ